jgi:hypothetical protein
VKYTHIAILLLGLVLPLVGCAAASAQDDDESVGVAPSALVGDNALNVNALNVNALNVNALNVNALNVNALAPQGLSAIQDPSANGELMRSLLRYAVGCAFDSSQSFSFNWTDSSGTVHEESYPGHIGLAPEWTTGPLSAFGGQMVSACLAARTNWYGVPVVISMRSKHDPLWIHVLDEERTAYPFLEGAFWGNLFAPTPYLRACHTEANIAHSRAAQRDCAAGHVDTAGGIETCGIIDIVGTCEEHCKKINVPGQLYWDCTDPVHGRTNNVITTALPP